MEIFEIKTCTCGNETFLENGVCWSCIESERELRSQVVIAYLTMTCNMPAVKRFIARDLREGLAERLIKE